ncbi:MAG: hypothetical protein IJP13_08545 [Lachnospiraceae bacterium]|nr:hypothetical protein [Lachnospiraceae bacterium]
MDNTTIAPVMEFHQITFDEYLLAKQEIANRLKNMTEDYVAVGYLFRQIKETEAYKQEGYNSLQEFAKDVYGISESEVSRFIAINMKFSKDGCSKELAVDYKGFGKSKLSEMLTMSDEDCKLITATTTVATIRELKNFTRESEKVAAAQKDIEDSGQETIIAEVVMPAEYTDLEQVIIEFFRDKRELLQEVYAMSSFEDIVEKINPSGNLSYRHKVYMLFMYGYGDGVVLKKMGERNVNYTWPQVIEAMIKIYGKTYTDHDTIWENFYKIEAEEMNNARDNMEVSAPGEQEANEESKEGKIEVPDGKVEADEKRDEELSEETDACESESASSSDEDKDNGAKAEAEKVDEETVGQQSKKDELDQKVLSGAILDVEEYHKYLYEKSIEEYVQDILEDKSLPLSVKIISISDQMEKLAKNYSEYMISKKR